MKRIDQLRMKIRNSERLKNNKLTYSVEEAKELLNEIESLQASQSAPVQDGPLHIEIDEGRF